MWSSGWPRGSICSIFFPPPPPRSPPTSKTATWRSALLPAIAAGLVCSALTAWAATALDVELLRKCFGGFLIVIGMRELFKKG